MRKTIPLSSILLYLNNPRLPESESEYESLCNMIQDQQKKLSLLAKDIAEHGMSELDLLAVFPDKKEGFYRVAEGNRRVSVLKLLQNPNIVIDKYPKVTKEFSELAQKHTIDFNNIDVAIFKSEQDPRLIHFLQIRHLGEQGGVGTVKWDPVQKGRFDYRTFGKENLVIFFDMLEKKGYLTREEINGVTTTNWNRIFRPVGIDCLRLEKEGNLYKIIDGCEKEFAIKIKLIAKRLKGASVAKVYGQPEIEHFIEDIENEYQHGSVEKENEGKTLINFPATVNIQNKEKSSMTNQQKPHDSVEYPSEVQIPAPESAQNNYSGTVTANKRMPHDPYANCKTVIPASVRLQSRNHRINQIISELKTLEVDTYPNACGCLLRALIELSAKEYLEHNSKQANYDATKIQFEDAIVQAASQMFQKNQLVAAESNSVKKETNSGGVRLLFNGYMHNTEVYPSPIVIKGIFLTYQKFLKECLL